MNRKLVIVFAALAMVCLAGMLVSGIADPNTPKKNMRTPYVMESIYSAWTGSLSGWSTIVSLTTPSLPTGYYKVELDAHAYMEYPSRLGIGIGVDSESLDATTTRYWQCDSSPFVSGSTYLGDVHTQEVFLLEAGAHTFYFRAGETSGGGGYCGLQNSHITVTFFPDGSVG